MSRAVKGPRPEDGRAPRENRAVKATVNATLDRLSRLIPGETMESQAGVAAHLAISLRRAPAAAGKTTGRGATENITRSAGLLSGPRGALAAVSVAVGPTRG
ncbi:hypothetical protein C357_18070 [Citreicella sp. 357]|nr:hypothetical protein C357_18070 [Citreicella sp. 357]